MFVSRGKKCLFFETFVHVLNPKLESIDDLLQLHLIVLNSVEKSTESGCLKILNFSALRQTNPIWEVSLYLLTTVKTHLWIHCSQDNKYH